MVSGTERQTAARQVWEGRVHPSGRGWPLEAGEKPWGGRRRDGPALLKTATPGSPVWVCWSSVSYTGKDTPYRVQWRESTPAPVHLVLMLRTTLWPGNWESDERAWSLEGDISHHTGTNRTSENAQQVTVEAQHVAAEVQMMTQISTPGPRVCTLLDQDGW